MRVVGPYTPTSVRDTDAFKIDVYRTFEVGAYSFSNHILTAEKIVTASYWKSGAMLKGTLWPTLYYIQIKSVYTVTFTLVNALPGKTTVGGVATESKIVIVFPTIMPASSVESVSNLDGNVNGATIKRDVTYTDSSNGIDCGLTYACYRISHTNVADVPAGKELRFLLTGPTNAISVQTAGNFHVQTLIEETVGGTTSAYNIDYGAFASVDGDGKALTTIQGAISPGGTS